MNTYTAKKVADALGVLDARWQDVPHVLLDYRWKDAYPSPYTTAARMVHSDAGITVRLSSTEWPLRAMRTVCNQQICEDSCMEFFFTPNEADKHYINIEVNPFGVTHIGIGEGRHGRTLLDVSGDGLKVETAIRPGEGWAVALFVPYSFIDKHFSSHANVIRANFYKCGDLTETVHYSTWSPVGTPAPDYHQPTFFGKITLAE